MKTLLSALLTLPTLLLSSVTFAVVLNVAWIATMYMSSAEFANQLFTEFSSVETWIVTLCCAAFALLFAVCAKKEH